MNNFLFSSLCFALVLTVTISCSKRDESSKESEKLTWSSVQDTSDMVVSISGFSGPEAVRYDPGQDVYFVSNFNGPGGEKDSNGFISKVSPEGKVIASRYMTGSESHPLHAPRGMYITGDTLWVADADGVHGFNKLTGDQVAFVDFAPFEPGFLNDVVQGEDGSLYVTDTGQSRVYKIENYQPSIVVDSLPAPPNGITIDKNKNLVLAPWQGKKTFYTLTEDHSGYAEYAQVRSGGNYDGIEFLDGRMIAASQVDSSLHVIYQGKDHIAVHVPGRPADIGLDTKRRQVAVPYIDLNRVDVWQLPR